MEEMNGIPVVPYGKTREYMAYLMTRRKGGKRAPKEKPPKDYRNTAKEIAKRMVCRSMIQKATYIDGVGAVPILNRIAKEMDLSIGQLSIFIAMNHIRMFTIESFELWGYGSLMVNYGMKKFVRKLKWVEVFPTHHHKRNSYVVSIRGKKAFKEFQAKYEQYTIEFYKHALDSGPVSPYRNNHKNIYRNRHDDDKAQF